MNDIFGERLFLNEREGVIPELFKMSLEQVSKGLFIPVFECPDDTGVVPFHG